MNFKLIFIFSLPRSGSTLLQRILSVHSDIETKSEMWFLLPLVYSLKNNGTYAQYSYVSLTNALNYLLTQLPNERQDYFDAIRLFADSLYSKLVKKDTKYFIDKTPRYYLIINEIEKIYPDAKFIFLFRHPLSILSSIITNFNRDKIGDFRHKIDIYKGPKMLEKGYNSIKNKCIAVSYESLLDNPQLVIKKICDYLSIDYNSSLIEEFHKIPLHGLGDKFGTKKYKKLEISRKEAWKSVLATKYRKKYALNYIKYLGKDTIKTFGYNFDKIISEINSLSLISKSSYKDLFSEKLCNIKSILELPMLKKKIKDTHLKKEKYYIHY